MGELDKKLDAFRAFIADAQRRTGWSPTRIAKEAKIVHTLITDRLSGLTTSVPKRETIQKIENATGATYRPCPKKALNPNDSSNDTSPPGDYDDNAVTERPPEAEMQKAREAAILLLTNFTLTEAHEIVEEAMRRRETEGRPTPPQRAGRTS